MELIFVHVGTQCFPPFFPPLDEGGVNLYMSLNTRVFVVVPFSVFVSSVRSPPKRYAKPPAPLDVVAVNVQLARPGIGRPQFASITISVRSASLISSSFKIRSMSFSASSSFVRPFFFFAFCSVFRSVLPGGQFRRRDLPSFLSCFLRLSRPPPISFWFTTLARRRRRR